jgi:hypothetical protein
MPPPIILPSDCAAPPRKDAVLPVTALYAEDSRLSGLENRPPAAPAVPAVPAAAALPNSDGAMLVMTPVTVRATGSTMARMMG